ncbi:hypothetical protein ABH994_005539 [Bradyrhizobium yuanmingense]|uniref:hypothetical protein n=1 Tax=Bradyrhizobium yuanmingense TaxID=108015 RepID=UPI0035122B50
MVSKKFSGTRERWSVRWGFRIRLREQMAVLGISGVLVTGVICVAALHYASIVQREASASNELKARVVSLSQSFLESGQIATEFLRKPTEMSIKTHADLLDRQLDDLSRVEKLIGELPGDDPLRQAASLRPVIDLYTTRF